jgi:hypothetical protein
MNARSLSTELLFVQGAKVVTPGGMETPQPFIPATTGGNNTGTNGKPHFVAPLQPSNELDAAGHEESGRQQQPTTLDDDLANHHAVASKILRAAGNLEDAAAAANRHEGLQQQRDAKAGASGPAANADTIDSTIAELLASVTEVSSLQHDKPTRCMQSCGIQLWVNEMHFGDELQQSHQLATSRTVWLVLVLHNNICKSLDAWLTQNVATQH